MVPYFQVQADLWSSMCVEGPTLRRNGNRPRGAQALAARGHGFAVSPGGLGGTCFLTLLFIHPLLENTLVDPAISRNGADSSILSGRFFKRPRVGRGPSRWVAVKGPL